MISKPSSMRRIACALVVVAFIAMTCQADGMPNPTMASTADALTFSVPSSRIAAGLRERFPAAEIRVARPEDVQRIVAAYEAGGYMVIPLAATSPEQGSGEGTGKQPPPDPSGSGLRGSNPNISFNGSGDAAKVLFIIIGLVVLAFLIVAGVDIAYDAIVRGNDHPRWLAVDAVYGWVHSEERVSPDEKKSRDNAEPRTIDRLAVWGVRLQGGIDDTKEHPTNRSRLSIGVSGEVGMLDGFVTLSDRRQRVALNNTYAMLGPLIRVWLVPNRQFLTLDLELLAGTADTERVGLMSMARFEFKWITPINLTLGAYYGALYLDVKSEGGLIREQGDFNEILGISIGYLF